MSSKLVRPVSRRHSPQNVPPPMLVPTGRGHAERGGCLKKGLGQTAQQSPQQHAAPAASRHLGHEWQCGPAAGTSCAATCNPGDTALQPHSAAGVPLRRRCCSTIKTVIKPQTKGHSPDTRWNLPSPSTRTMLTPLPMFTSRYG